LTVLHLKSLYMAEETIRKKKKKHNPVIDWLIYIMLRLMVVFLSMFSIQINLNTACFLGRLLWKYYHRGRLRALENLRASFPQAPEQWIWQTGMRSFEHLAMFAMDTLFVPRLITKKNWRDFCKFKNTERAKWLMQEGNGLLMVTAHYGNFEITGYLMGLFGFNIYSIARPLDNKYISNYIYGLRESTGLKIIDKKGATESMEEILSSGATLGFIADQDAGKKGIFVDFFGRKASTYKSIGLLAITYNLPIAVGYSRRIGNKFFYEIGCNRIIMPHEWANKENPLEWITAEYSSAIEQFIREEPGQYWWLHRRWKHRPKNEQQTTQQ
jgi:Kdo2-lipid IVA lauroyltransferase/acyltransferase